MCLYSSYSYKDLEGRNLKVFPVHVLPSGCHFYVIMKLEASSSKPFFTPVYLRDDTLPTSLILSWTVGVKRGNI